MNVITSDGLPGGQRQAGHAAVHVAAVEQTGGGPSRGVTRRPSCAGDAGPSPACRHPGLSHEPAGKARGDLAEPAAFTGADSRPPVTAESFRRALARHPAGVAIVTLSGAAGPVGLTVTSFSSASLEPPLVSFYVGHGSSSWPEMGLARHFAVNLIGIGQEALASRFARKGEDRFAPPTKWHTGTAGLPLLVDATTHLVCVKHQQVTVGDHELMVGRVIEVAVGQGGDRPLLHHQGRFTRAEQR